MIPQPYTQLSTLDLLTLCVWREARGEQSPGQRGVSHVIRNRTFLPAWWNNHKTGDYHAVILFPYQFSSFNPSDPQDDLWPSEGADFALCRESAMWVPCGLDPDNTDGATDYFDTSITWPQAWGNQSDWINTVNYGRLRFWKLKSGLAGLKYGPRRNAASVRNSHSVI